MASNDIRSDIGENSKSKGVVGDVLELFNGTLPPTQSDIDVSNNCIIAVNPHAVRVLVCCMWCMCIGCACSCKR